jgi:tRNA uridine 5-carbamoylmethylation protein Kti12
MQDEISERETSKIKKREIFPNIKNRWETPKFMLDEDGNFEEVISDLIVIECR